VRIAVHGLQVKAEELKVRGIGFDWIESSEAVDGRSLIRIHASELDGQLFEFEEFQAPPAVAH
jgi:hypothetical protein